MPCHDKLIDLSHTIPDNAQFNLFTLNTRWQQCTLTAAPLVEIKLTARPQSEHTEFSDASCIRGCMEGPEASIILVNMAEWEKWTMNVCLSLLISAQIGMGLCCEALVLECLVNDGHMNSLEPQITLDDEIFVDKGQGMDTTKLGEFQKILEFPSENNNTLSI